jgi:hypothetical protein
MKTMDATSTTADVEKIIREELDALRLRIIQNISNSGKRASGRTQDSLTVNVQQQGTSVIGELTGRSLFGALETGSKPWRTQYARPPKFFIEIIQDWMMEKGISGPAGAIAYSIMKRGSAQFRQGQREDIYSEEITKAYDEIQKRVAGLFEAQIIQSLLR